MPELATSGAVDQVRTLFLRKVAHVKPDFTSDLHRECYKLFSTFQAVRPHAISVSQLHSDPQLAPLYFALKRWAKPYHLEAEWCYAKALSQLDEWYSPLPEELEETAPQPWARKTLSLHFGADPVPPPEGFTSYHPDFEKRQQYLAKCKSELKAALSQPAFALASIQAKAALRDHIMEKLKQYCEKVERCYKKELDYLPVKVRRNFRRNLTWAIRIQILGDSASDIARERTTTRMPPSTVTRQFEAFLSFIDLKPRPDYKRGRRVGSEPQYRSHPKD